MGVNVHAMEIEDVKLLEVPRFGDDRGFFSETYNERQLAEQGIELKFVQDNHSRSGEKGTVRGLHFQIPPHAQAKLVRVARGSILDVAVDIRHGSPTYGRHVSAIISAEAWNQILVPVGFAHGFCTLEPDTEVLYKVDSYYSPECDRGLLWCDPQLGIDWPVTPEQAVLSEKDQNHPPLAELEEFFRWVRT